MKYYKNKMIDAAVKKAITEFPKISDLVSMLYLKYSAGIVKPAVKLLKTLNSI